MGVVVAGASGEVVVLVENVVGGVLVIGGLVVAALPSSGTGPAGSMIAAWRLPISPYSGSPMAVTLGPSVVEEAADEEGIVELALPVPERVTVGSEFPSPPSPPSGMPPGGMIPGGGTPPMIPVLDQ